MKEDVLVRLQDVASRIQYVNNYILLQDAIQEIESLRSYVADLQAELCRLERENARHV